MEHKEAGKVTLRYREVLEIASAVAQLTARYLPTVEARMHLARCRRALKPLVEDYNAERQRIQAEHTPDDQAIEEGQQFAFKNPAQLTRKITELDYVQVAVDLPKPIAAAMLPVNDKAHPNNEDGLAMLQADLGPLFILERGSDEV